MALAATGHGGQCRSGAPLQGCCLIVAARPRRCTRLGGSGGRGQVTPGGGLPRQRAVLCETMAAGVSVYQAGAAGRSLLSSPVRRLERFSVAFTL